MQGVPVFEITEGDKTGKAVYYSGFLSQDKISDLTKDLDDVAYTQDLVNTPGGKKLAPRWTEVFGEPGTVYGYAGMERKPQLEWPESLKRCRDEIQEELGCQLNYAFINRYDNGSQYIGWHSDSETDLVPGALIASVSLGESRKFQLRRKYKAGVDDPTPISTQVLQSGSLCTMEGDLQDLTKHCVPKEPKKTGVRYNITFRNMKKRGRE
jgi:alkylated DNA repair dioxygenase AlkB